VQVLKIEGRARPPEYVHTVVSCYREAAEAYQQGTFGPELVAQWNQRLATVFNRGFWDGYYLGRKLGEWTDSYGSKATKTKIYVGPSTNYFKNIGIAEIKLEASALAVGDEILITGPTTGVIQTHVTELRLDKQPVAQAPKGSTISLPIAHTVRRADKVYKLIPTSGTQS
jgi:putative protease